MLDGIRGEEDCEAKGDSFRIQTLLILSIATSIDALAVGVTLSFMETNIWLDIAIIGVLTFFIAGAGVFVGNIFGSKFKSKAEFAGGLILVILGVKILLEHTLGY